MRIKKLDELEALARAATPGPWVTDRPWLSRGLMHVDGVMPRANLHPEEPYQVKTEHNHGTLSYSKHVAVPALGHSAEDGSDAARNMEFIAAMNPAQALKLIEVIRLQQEALEFYQSPRHMGCRPSGDHDDPSWCDESCGDYGKRARKAISRAREVMGG